MEWNKAKKYTIIILVLLNAVLLCLNVYKGFETRLGSSRINAVTSLLESRNITIGSTLPRSYKPMADISVSEYSFDYIKLEKIFLEGQSNIRRTDENNSVVFMSDTSRLTIKGGTINFTSTCDSEFSNEKAVKEYTQNLIDRINGDFGNYKFHSINQISGGYSVKFYEKTDNYYIFSNFAYFTIKGNNIALALNYAKIGNELSIKNNIYAADEALYSAADLISKENEKPLITSIELGYYAIKSSTGSDETATPFYLIFANGNEYYVNAYTGECF